MSVAPPDFSGDEARQKLTIVCCEYCENFPNFVDSFNPPSRSSDAWPRTASWPAAELGLGARFGDHTQATAS